MCTFASLSLTASLSVRSVCPNKRHGHLYEVREQMMWPIHRSNLLAAQKRLNEFDALLVQYLREFSKSQCKSPKHHQWSHYAQHRLQTGCSAMEMAFEKSYAVGHKKHVAHTNKALPRAAQTATKHHFRNACRRLASHVGLPMRHPTTVHPHHAGASEMEGPFTSLENHKWETPRAAQVMAVKGAAMRPRLLRASTAMAVNVVNRLARPHSALRHRNLYLRAAHAVENPVVDTVKMQHAAEAGAAVMGFGRCLGFFVDTDDHTFVAVQWYKICGRSAMGGVSGMTKVELVDTFDFMPTSSVINGTLLMPLYSDAAVLGRPKQFWALQSHREQRAFME